MHEGYYFWRQAGWRIPDPKDPNPLRYAILASLAESMVDAYNWKISLRLRRVVEPVSILDWLPVRSRCELWTRRQSNIETCSFS